MGGGCSVHQYSPLNKHIPVVKLTDQVVHKPEPVKSLSWGGEKQNCVLGKRRQFQGYPTTGQWRIGMRFTYMKLDPQMFRPNQSQSF